MIQARIVDEYVDQYPPELSRVLHRPEGVRVEWVVEPERFALATDRRWHLGDPTPDILGLGTRLVAKVQARGSDRITYVEADPDEPTH